MTDFETVSREIHGIIDRRRELDTFLGSVFAALGIFLQNALQGGLPVSLAQVQEPLLCWRLWLLRLPWSSSGERPNRRERKTPWPD